VSPNYFSKHSSIRILLNKLRIASSFEKEGGRMRGRGRGSARERESVCVCVRKMHSFPAFFASLPAFFLSQRLYIVAKAIHSHTHTSVCVCVRKNALCIAFERERMQAKAIHSEF